MRSSCKSLVEIQGSFLSIDKNFVCFTVEWITYHPAQMNIPSKGRFLVLLRNHQQFMMMLKIQKIQRKSFVKLSKICISKPYAL